MEGNIGVGKTEFAKRLASEFDLKFFPATPERNCFLQRDYNFDIRALDPVFPSTAKSYDLKRFYSDPHPESGMVGRLQLRWYEEKFYDYLQALKHLLSTGILFRLVAYCCINLNFKYVFHPFCIHTLLHCTNHLHMTFLQYYTIKASFQSATDGK